MLYFPVPSNSKRLSVNPVTWKVLVFPLGVLYLNPIIPFFFSGQDIHFIDNFVSFIFSETFS